MPDIHSAQLARVAQLTAATFPWLRVGYATGVHGELVDSVRATLLNRADATLHLDLAMTGIDGWTVTPLIDGRARGVFVQEPSPLPVGLMPSDEALASAFARVILDVIGRAEAAGLVPEGTAASATGVAPQVALSERQAGSFHPLSLVGLIVALIPMFIPAPGIALVVATITALLNVAAFTHVLVEQKSGKTLLGVAIAISTVVWFAAFYFTLVNGFYGER